MTIVRAKLDTGSAPMADQLQQLLEKAQSDEVRLVGREANTVIVEGEAEQLHGWVNCLRARGITRGLIHARLHAGLTNAVPVASPAPPASSPTL